MDQDTYNCLLLSSKQLKEELRKLNVSGRGKLTTKKAMCQKLLEIGWKPFTDYELPEKYRFETVVPPIKTLPIEIFEQYVSELPIKDILNLCQVDRDFSKICQNDRFWYQLYLNKYPNNSQDIIVDPEHAIKFLTWKEQMIKTSDYGFSLSRMMNKYWILSEPIPEDLPHIWIKGPIELNFRFFSDIIPGTAIIDKSEITPEEIFGAIANFYHQNKNLFGPYNIYYRGIEKILPKTGNLKRYIISTGY